MVEKSLDLESMAIDKRDMPDIDYKVPHITDAELAHSWREYQ